MFNLSKKIFFFFSINLHISLITKWFFWSFGRHSDKTVTHSELLLDIDNFRNKIVDVIRKFHESSFKIVRVITIVVSNSVNFLVNARLWRQPIKYYSSVSDELRETKAAIWVRGSICYRGHGSVKSTVLFLNFSHIMQLDICVRALERITNKKSRFTVAHASMGKDNFSNRCS